MTRATRIVRCILLPATLALLVAGVAAPYLSGEHFRSQIQEALQRSLGRRVAIGSVHFNLFHGPGFSVDDVVIYENPAYGAEPFAYVDSLDARVGLLSLLRGKLEFSNLRLVEPSVNLVKLPEGPWNFQALLQRSVAGKGAGGRHALPEIQVRSGRLNFKFGALKSVFYFTDADVDFWPESDGGFGLRFTGSPARTDRSAQGFGRLIGSGRLLAPVNGERSLDFNLELDKSNISEVMTLLQGRDIGLHGLVAWRAHLAGPLSGVQVAGRLEIQDIHRWDLMPPAGEAWPLDFKGQLDLRAQQVELETQASGAAPLPLSVRFRAEGYLTSPKWVITATAKDFPVSPLQEVARHMGAPLPPGVIADGKLNGVVSYSSESGAQGDIELSAASLQVPDTPPIRVPAAQISIDGNQVDLNPATIELAGAEKLEVAAAYDAGTQDLDVKMSTAAFKIADLRSGTGSLLGAGRLRLFENCESGSWRGVLRYHAEGDAAPEWSGAFEVHDARLAVPGLAVPVRLDTASASLKGDRLVVNRIRGVAGKTRFEGDYRYEPPLARPHRFRFSIAEAQAEDFEAIFLPALQRRQGFLSRTFRLGRAPVPEWMKAYHASGTFEIGALRIGGSTLEQFSGAVVWDGARVELTDLQGQVEGGAVSGSVFIDLTASAPLYEAGLAFEDIPSHLGNFGADVYFETSGVGAIALLSRLRVRTLDVTLGDDDYHGEAVAGRDGRLLVDLTDGKKQIRFAGTIAPFQLDPVANPEPAQGVSRK